MKNKDLQRIFRLLAMVSQIGLMVISSIGIGFIIGYFLDRLLGFEFILTLIFGLLGIGSGFWTVYQMLHKILMNNDKKDE